MRTFRVLQPMLLGVRVEMPTGRSEGRLALRHAIHIHAVAKCEAPFTSAGGHFNLDTKKHGLENPEGPHAGDMNNFTVAANGTAKTTVTNSRVSLGMGANSVFSNGGTALVIHAKADDRKTDPAGNAGDRIACGTITKSRQRLIEACLLYTSDAADDLLCV